MSAETFDSTPLTPELPANVAQLIQKEAEEASIVRYGKRIEFKRRDSALDNSAEWDGFKEDYIGIATKWFIIEKKENKLPQSVDMAYSLNDGSGMIGVIKHYPNNMISTGQALKAQKLVEALEYIKKLNHANGDDILVLGDLIETALKQYNEPI